jgi:hypothetical protein
MNFEILDVTKCKLGILWSGLRFRSYRQCYASAMRVRTDGRSPEGSNLASRVQAHALFPFLNSLDNRRVLSLDHTVICRLEVSLFLHA